MAELLAIILIIVKFALGGSLGSDKGGVDSYIVTSIYTGK